MDRMTEITRGPGLFRAISSSIRSKLLLSMLVVAIIPLFLLGAAVYFNAEKALIAKSIDQLEAVRSIKANQLQQYFQTLRAQIAILAEDQTVIEAMKDLQISFRTAIAENEVDPPKLEEMRKQLQTYYADEFNGEYRRRNANQAPKIDALFETLDQDSVYLQYEYLRNNPNAVGWKQQLDRAGDRSSYSEYHAKYHPVVRSFQEKFGLQDIVLADVETGDIVYSCLKGIEFTTSLKDGPHSKSNLGRAFADAANADSPEAISFADFEPYLASYNQAAMFLAAPVYDDDQKIGVVAVQIPIDRVSAILAERTGLGASGETFAVGSDELFRNESRFVKNLQAAGRITRATTIINPEIKLADAATRDALLGKSSTQQVTDYRGESVLESWQPVAVHAATDSDKSILWALISKIDLAEVRDPIRRMLLAMATTAALSIVVVVVAGYALAGTLTRQATAITDMLGQIGIGNFDARAQVISEDELGTVAMSLNAMCDNTLSLIQTREERDEIQLAVHKLKEEVAVIASGDLTQEAEITNDFTGGIAESINEMIEQLRTIIGNIHEATAQVTTSATEIEKTTDELGRGAEQQSAQITGASSAIQEMALSIQEVSKHTAKTATVADKARENAVQGTKAVRDTIQGMERIRDQVQDNAKRIKRLAESSQEVGQIVQLIADIADRTSILALNASIQAAMAGDAGKGFAIVAEEVERLAERANQSTKQIESLIKAIQSETAGAITAMEECTTEVVAGSKLAAEAGHALAEIDSVSKDLAELTHSMTRATREQAQGADELSKSMGDISQVTRQTAFETKQAAESVGNLAGLAEALQESVSAFQLPIAAPRSALVFDDEEVVPSPMGSLILKALK